MKKWLFVFGFACLQAQVCIDDLSLDADIVPRGSWQGRGEMLYWRADTGGFDYAFAPAGTLGKQREQVLRGENHFGWRLGLGYTSCEESWWGEVTALVLHARDDARTKLSLAPRIAAFTQIPTTQVHGQLEHDYGNVDVRFGRYVWQSDQADFDLFAGFRSSWLRELRRTRSAVAVGRERTGFWGIGPGLGFGGRVGTLEGFDFHGHLEVLALIGNRSHSLLASHFPDQTVVVPALDFRLALTYSQEVDCFLMSLTAGFEHHYYFNPIAPSFSGLNGPNLLKQEPRDLGFGGPFIGLQVNY